MQAQKNILDKRGKSEVTHIYSIHLSKNKLNPIHSRNERMPQINNTVYSFFVEKIDF